MEIKDPVIREITRKEYFAMAESLDSMCSPHGYRPKEFFVKNRDTCLVAFYGEEPIGFTLVRNNDQGYTPHVTDTYLDIICVAPAYRGYFNVFRLLMGAVQDLTRQRALTRNSTEAYISLHSATQELMGLYRRLGFHGDDYRIDMKSSNILVTPLNLNPHKYASAPFPPQGNATDDPTLDFVRMEQPGGGEEVLYGTREELLALGYSPEELIPTGMEQETGYAPSPQPTPSVFMELSPDTPSVAPITPSVYFGGISPVQSPMEPIDYSYNNWTATPPPTYQQPSPSTNPEFEQENPFDYQTPQPSPIDIGGGMTFYPTEYPELSPGSPEPLYQPTPPPASPIFAPPPTPTQVAIAEFVAQESLAPNAPVELSQAELEELALPPRPRVAKRKERMEATGEPEYREIEAVAKASRENITGFDETTKLRLTAFARRANRFAALVNMFYRLETKVDEGSHEGYEKLRALVARIDKRITENDEIAQRTVYTARVYTCSPADQPDFVDIVYDSDTIVRATSTAALIVYDIGTYAAEVTLIMLRKQAGGDRDVRLRLEGEFIKALSTIYIALSMSTYNGLGVQFRDIWLKKLAVFQNVGPSNITYTCNLLDEGLAALEDSLRRAFTILVHPDMYKIAMEGDKVYNEALYMHPILPKRTWKEEVNQEEIKQTIVDVHNKNVFATKRDLVPGTAFDADTVPDWPTIAELRLRAAKSMSYINTEEEEEGSSVNTSTESSMSSANTSYSLLSDEDITDLQFATSRMSLQSRNTNTVVETPA